MKRSIKASSSKSFLWKRCKRFGIRRRQLNRSLRSKPKGSLKANGKGSTLNRSFCLSRFWWLTLRCSIEKITNAAKLTACNDMRPYLSWIEGLTTNQYVGGSNPSGRTIFEFVKTLLMRGFSFLSISSF